MTDYEKLKGIIDEIDNFISHHVCSSAPAFEAWHTKAERFLIKKYGKDSLEHQKFLDTYFAPLVWCSEDEEQDIEFETVGKEVSEEQNRLRKLLNMSVNEIELSVRAANCLNNANITTVGELAMKSEQEMLKYRNFGKKSLNEIKSKLEQLGLSLGMKIDERLIDSTTL